MLRILPDNCKCLWKYITCGSHFQGSKGAPGSPGPVGPPVSYLTMIEATFIETMNEQNKNKYLLNIHINQIFLFSILPDCILILLQGPQGMRGLEGPEGHLGPDVS